MGPRVAGLLDYWPIARECIRGENVNSSADSAARALVRTNTDANMRAYTGALCADSTHHAEKQEDRELLYNHVDKNKP